MDEIFKRNSIRSYQSKEVNDDDIEYILKAAMQAPSARNTQPWEFLVVKNKEILNELSEKLIYGKFIKTAPMIIVPCFKTELGDYKWKEIDLAICSENILLAATSLSLGSCYIGIDPIKERIELVKSMLQIDDSLSPFAIITIGYKNEEKEIINRFDKKRIHYID
ncbi:MAG: nitroreductase family protein [Bacilli bacterium]